MPGIGLVLEGRQIERILDRLVSTNEVIVVGRDDTEREVTVDELKRLLRRWPDDQFLVNEDAGYYAIIPLAPLFSGDPKPSEKCITAIVAQFAGAGVWIASFLMISIITVIATSPGDGFVESFMALLIIGIILGVLGWNLPPRTGVHSLLVGLYVSLVLSKISFALIVERK